MHEYGRLELQLWTARATITRGERVIHDFDKRACTGYTLLVPAKEAGYWDCLKALLGDTKSHGACYLHPRRTCARILIYDFRAFTGPPVTKLSEDKYFTIHSLTSLDMSRCTLCSSSDVNFEYMLTPSTLRDFVKSYRKIDHGDSEYLFSRSQPLSASLS